MPPAGYPAFLQYLQSGRVRKFNHLLPAMPELGMGLPNAYIVVEKSAER